MHILISYICNMYIKVRHTCHWWSFYAPRRRLPREFNSFVICNPNNHQSMLREQLLKQDVTMKNLWTGFDVSRHTWSDLANYFLEEFIHMTSLSYIKDAHISSTKALKIFLQNACKFSKCWYFVLFPNKGIRHHSRLMNM